MSFGFFRVNKIDTLDYIKYGNDQSNPPMMLTILGKVYDFKRSSFSFGEIKNQNADLLYVKYQNKTS